MLNLEDIRAYCLRKPGTSEDMPFGEDTLVFRVLGKIFLLTGLNSSDYTLNLKCNPEYAVELREIYQDVKSGYHMNKKHWNTVNFHGDLPASLILSLIDHSYEQVVKGLSATAKAILKQDLPD